MNIAFEGSKNYSQQSKIYIFIKKLYNIDYNQYFSVYFFTEPYLYN